MNVQPGATDVTTYFVMRLTADGTVATGLTPADFDLQYVKTGAVPVAKVDATLNGNGIGGAHSDNTVIEVDETDQPGLYRIDWPDAAFAGVADDEVILTAKIATAFAEHLRVELSPPVDVQAINGSETFADDLGSFMENGLGADSKVLISRETGFFLHNAIIDSVTDQTNFVITTGSDATDNDAYLGALAVFIDNADPNQVSFRLVTNYVASTRTVTVNADPDFVVTDIDRMVILPQATATTVWDRVLTGATHNIPTSAGRRLRGIQEFQGYEDGAVWIDTTANGSAGTTNFENGTVENPVDNINDANTLATSLGLSRFRIAPNSSITLAAAQENQVFIGDRWTLALNDKSISGSFFSGADVSGTGTGANEVRFEHCHFANVTLPPSDMERCVLEGTFTIGREGDFFFENCSSGVAGASTPILDFGSARNSSDVNIRNYSGGLEIQYIGENTGTYNLSFDCPAGQIVFNANCSADSVIELRGNHRLTNNATGLTINDDARIDVGQIAALSAAAVADAVLDELVAAHVIAGSLSATIAALTPNVNLSSEGTNISSCKE